jgi:hypothetical protein
MVRRFSSADVSDQYCEDSALRSRRHRLDRPSEIHDPQVTETDHGWNNCSFNAW